MNTTDRQDPKLRAIWKQKCIPVIYRRQKPEPLLVRLPFQDDNYGWLRDGQQRKPNWNDQFTAWETPIAWFDKLVERALRRYQQIYVIQLHREHQKCAPACWNAKGFDCECSCLGEHHGSGHPDGKWREVSETFAFSWGSRQYACRLIKVRPTS